MAATKTPKKTAAKKTTAKPAAKKAAAKKAAPAAKKAAAKKVAASDGSGRMLHKVSPLAGMSVDDFVKRVSGWQAEAVAAIIKLVRDVAPEASHAVKWGQPVFDHGGPVAFVKPAKAHVTFGFWRGAELKDPTGLLEGGDRMKHVKLKSLDAIDVKVLGAFLKEAVRLNKEKGNPAMRAKK
jgi:hypothetical protein